MVYHISRRHWLSLDFYYQLGRDKLPWGLGIGFLRRLMLGKDIVWAVDTIKIVADGICIQKDRWKWNTHAYP